MGGSVGRGGDNFLQSVGRRRESLVRSRRGCWPRARAAGPSGHDDIAALAVAISMKRTLRKGLGRKCAESGVDLVNISQLGFIDASPREQSTTATVLFLGGDNLTGERTGNGLRKRLEGYIPRIGLAEVKRV